MNKLVKRTIIVNLAILLPSQTLCIADENRNVRIMVNGQPTEYNDTYISDDCTMIDYNDLGKIIENYVKWNVDTYEIEIVRSLSDSIFLKISDSKIIKENGEIISVEKSAEIKDGKMYVPLRAMCEACGASVQWNENDYTVDINTRKPFEILEDTISLDLPINVIKIGKTYYDFCYHGVLYIVTAEVLNIKSSGDMKTDAENNGYTIIGDDYISFKDIECIQLSPIDEGFDEYYWLKTKNGLLIGVRFILAQYADKIDHESVLEILETAQILK